MFIINLFFDTINIGGNMQDKMGILLKQIKLNDSDYHYFNNAYLTRIIGNKDKDSYKFLIKLDTNLPVDIYDTFNNGLIKAFPTIRKVFAKFEIDQVNFNLLKDYLHYFMQMIIKERPLIGLISDDAIVITDKQIDILVANKAEERQILDIKDILLEKFINAGYADLNISIVIDSNLNVNINKEITEAMQPNIVLPKKPVGVPKTEEKKGKFVPKEHRPLIVDKDNEAVVMGRVIDDEVEIIKNIITPMNNVTIEGTIFGDDVIETKTGLKIMTLKITDYTDSIYGKLFIHDDEEFKSIKKGLKKSGWFTFRGGVKDDAYSKELTFNIRDINVLERESDEILDEAPVKRVELHAHTMMSQMDGVVQAKELLKTAKKWGHKAIAITDHNGVQAFPDVYHTVCDFNKGIEKEEDKFKAIYGTELFMIDDSVDIVTRPNDTILLDNTYVVFDFETTGFNAGGKDSIIEIGAVKINNGEIIDRYDELVNPGHKLASKIIEVTNITDDMLEGKDTEENAIKRFKEWYGDLPMVAHNAKFDVSFLEMALLKYNLGEFNNPVIDTLELSRTLDTGFARHSLSALVKRYNVPWDETAHHRADYDAEGTALVFHKMLKKLNDRNIEKMNELDKLVSKDEIHKYGRGCHINILTRNKVGLKNLFKIISLANTKYLYKTPRILRSEISNLREGLLIGSGCYEGEVFTLARSKSEEELANVINFYDYVEVQPLECYDHLLQMKDFENQNEIIENIKKVIRVTEDAGKIVVATGDVHHLYRDDKIYREIIVNQKVPGGGRHPLARNNITSIPSNHFRTTAEMLEDFAYLGSDKAYELVVTNPNKIADMTEIIEVIIETGGVPFSPKIDASVETVTSLVYDKAKEWYGDPLPHNIEERIAKELYGDGVYNSIKDLLINDKSIAEDQLEDEIFKKVHETILKGFDAVKILIRDNIKGKLTEEISDAELEKRVKKNLGGIIGGGFDVIYLIAQKLVKHSNDEGYLVGSRGSVGSSFVATMMGITEVNPLPAHYRCKKCQHSIFNDDNGKPLGADYSSGFDLPDKVCPICGTNLYKDGQDMPFATFLGFNADKVPDIDLNFSDLNQASAHAYTKVLFGEDNVYRAGTIGTVADKTAFGYVKGYCEDKGITMRTAEVERLALGCTGVKRTTGQHPGGIVVIPGYMDVFDFTPFQFPADDVTAEWRTTHFDYHAIDQDVLKLDILGHSDPTQLRMIQDLTKTDILEVPLDDKDTMSIFTSTKALGVTNEQIMCETGTLGIPEFGTPFTISMVAETKPKTFAELIKISGLSHGTDVWLGNAQELIKNKIVPFKEVIGCRDDIMVYLMYKGVEPIKAFKIMEFVRKGRASKDPETWETHRETMEQAGIEKWFIDSCQKIKYMFPKAHAAAYVISAFRIAWYKVHMPVYFYASWLTSKATDVDVETMIKGYDAIKNKIIEIQSKGYEATNKELGQLESLKVCLEATARGIKFLPIELDKSNATVWNVKDDTSIYPPFASIDGLGDTVAKNIVVEREKGDFLSIEDLQKRAKISGTLIEKLRSMGILDGMDESSQLSLF